MASINNGMLPQEVINKIRNKIKDELPEEQKVEPTEEQVNNDLELEKAKLQLHSIM